MSCSLPDKLELSSCTAPVPLPPSNSGNVFLISSLSNIADLLATAISFAIVLFPAAGGPRTIVTSLFLAIVPGI